MNMHRADRDTNIAQVAARITGLGLTDAQVRAINARQGWSFDVRYPSTSYVRDNDFTRVKGLKLLETDLHDAILRTKDWSARR